MTVGVTTIVANIDPEVELVAAKDGISPIPLAPMPINEFELVQLNEPPIGRLTKLVVGIITLWQTSIFEGTVTIGVGLTVIVYVEGVPIQLFTVGITIIVAVILDVLVFVAVKVGIFPVPIAAKPTAVLEFDHVNVPPAGKLIKLDAGTVPLLQTTMLAGTVTNGVGLTVIV